MTIDRWISTELVPALNSFNYIGEKIEAGKQEGVIYAEQFYIFGAWEYGKHLQSNELIDEVVVNEKYFSLVNNTHFSQFFYNMYKIKIILSVY